jgi:large subunit ribosomal protein L15
VLKQYKPVSLYELQRLIDLGRLDPTQPIDLTSICNTKLLKIEAAKREFGIQLTDEVFNFLVSSCTKKWHF